MKHIRLQLQTCLTVVLMLGFGWGSACHADDNSIAGEEVKQGNTIILVANIRNCSDAVIRVTGTLTNMVSTPSLPFTVNVTGQSRIVLAVLTPLATADTWTYKWKADWRYGHVSSAPIAVNYAYTLPYRTAQYVVIQGSRGEFSHFVGSQNEEAIDFAMPIGTIVTAARPGVVVAFRDDSMVGGSDPRLITEANYLVIRHEDGTYAEYYHLKQAGVLVAIGDLITVGQAIALSGNTGLTTTPHLHFQVFRKLTTLTKTSLPVRFRSVAGTFRAIEGEQY